MKQLTKRGTYAKFALEQQAEVVKYTLDHRLFSVRAAGTKIKTAKISTGALGGDSTKFCIHENFPLYVHYTEWSVCCRHGNSWRQEGYT